MTAAPTAAAARDAGAVVLPSSDDAFVGGAAEALGGPPGRHARLGDRRTGTPVRWLVAITLLTSLLGFWQKAPCRTHPWVAEYQYTRACYTDVFALYYAEQLNTGAVPYVQHPVEYPPVIGVAMQLVASAVHVLPEQDRPKRFYDLTWALLTLCAVAVTLTTARLAGRRRPWDAALFAAAPGLLLHGTTNWDLIATALAGLGLLAWARGRPVQAGIWLGLGTATKLYPALFLLPLLALCLRAGRTRAWLRTAVATVLAAAVVCVPVYLVSPSFADQGGTQVQVAGSPLSRLGSQGLSALSPHVAVAGTTGTNAVWRFVELNRTRGADWDSLYFLAARVNPSLSLDGTRGPSGAPDALNRAVEVGLVLWLCLVVALALRAPRRPRLPQLLFLTLAGFFLTNKVFSPQYVIWLLPLAVLAHPRWRPFLAWQATEVLVLLSRYYFFVGNDKPGQGIGFAWFAAAVLLRDLALVAWCALVVRDVLRPDLDPVRSTTGQDDPAGGVLAGAPDVRGPRAGPAAAPVPA